MKQVIQNYNTGDLNLIEVPSPVCGPNSVIVQNEASIISIGTERSIIELGKQSLLGKARQRPDLVKRFIEKAKNEGLIKTFHEAMGRLDSPTALGYSSAGIVVEKGSLVNEINVGDRVACIGAGYASHAEYISVPEMLCAKIPEKVSIEEASFGMLGIISMHGIRTAEATPGAVIAVEGLGLLGLLAVQILRAYGYIVIGFDPDLRKIMLAKQLGFNECYTDIDTFKASCARCSEGHGIDAIIVTAASKDSSAIELAIDIARYGARIVVIGVADIHPSRNEMWHKEVEIIVSKAGGPGSLDPIYENGGIDYPPGFVRWTERRNLQEFLRLIEIGQVNISSLITHRVDLANVQKIYEDIIANKGGPYVGVVVRYPSRGIEFSSDHQLIISKRKQDLDLLGIGVIGAGLFGSTVLLPSLKKCKGLSLIGLATNTGSKAEHITRKFGFSYASTDSQILLNDEQIRAVIIATSHSSHARLVLEALKAEKDIFVEKPLCISEEELAEIKSAISRSEHFLMVGYNRRFSRHAQEARKCIERMKQPMVISYRVNAGFVPRNHWVHSEKEGRSRIVGEMVHFFDMVQFLTSSLINRVYAERISADNSSIINNDNIVVTLHTNDGSVATLTYSASGNRSFPREQVDIHIGGNTIMINDYRNTHFALKSGIRNLKTANQDMGYQQELQHFINICKGSEQPLLSFNEIMNSTMAAFKIEESLSRGKAIEL